MVIESANMSRYKVIHYSQYSSHCRQSADCTDDQQLIGNHLQMITVMLVIAIILLVFST